MEQQGSRIVHQVDALVWLKENKIDSNASLVASMPDYSEFPELSLIEWKNWFQKTAEIIIESTPDHGVAIFYQSDIKHEGIWINKAYLVLKAAENAGAELLWHKIAPRLPVGKTSFGRPSYTHILSFSKKLKLDPANSTPDVLDHVGKKTWERGMGENAAEMIVKFIKKEVKSSVIINPFCGEGLILSVANNHGLDAIGIERSAKRAEKSRQLS